MYEQLHNQMGPAIPNIQYNCLIYIISYILSKGMQNVIPNTQNTYIGCAYPLCVNNYILK